MKINGIPVREMIVYPGKYFLVRVVPQGREEFYSLQNRPGRKNKSGEECLKGWLGETDNISRYAEGAVEVYMDSAKRKRVRFIDAEKLNSQDEAVSTASDKRSTNEAYVRLPMDALRKGRVKIAQNLIQGLVKGGISPKEVAAGFSSALRDGRLLSLDFGATKVVEDDIAQSLAACADLIEVLERMESR